MTDLDIRLTHVDGPTLLIELAGLRILTDPTFDPAGTEYALGPVHLTKTTDPAIPADRIGTIDCILLSHDQHADNLDHAGRAMLAQARTVFTTVSGAERLGGNARGLRRWETATLPLADGRELTITGTPARHGPAGSEPVTGDVTGFILTWPGRQDDKGLLRTVYISGDTVWFQDLTEIGTRFKIDLAALHLGNVHFGAVSPENLTMNAVEAATLVRELSIPRVAPIHIDGWQHFQEPREKVQAVFDEEGLSERLIWLAPGNPTHL